MKQEHPELQAECRGTDKEQEKHQETESPHTGEDSTDSGALTKPDARVLRNRKETKRKAEALPLRQTGNCQGLKCPKLTGDGDSENSIVCDEVKVQQVKFYVISRGTSKMSAKGTHIIILCTVHSAYAITTIYKLTSLLYMASHQ